MHQPPPTRTLHSPLRFPLSGCSRKVGTFRACIGRWESKAARMIRMRSTCPTCRRLASFRSKNRRRRRSEIRCIDTLCQLSESQRRRRPAQRARLLWFVQDTTPSLPDWCISEMVAPEAMVPRHATESSENDCLRPARCCGIEPLLQAERLAGDPDLAYDGLQKSWHDVLARIRAPLVGPGRQPAAECAASSPERVRARAGQREADPSPALRCRWVAGSSCGCPASRWRLLPEPNRDVLELRFKQ